MNDSSAARDSIFWGKIDKKIIQNVSKRQGRQLSRISLSFFKKDVSLSRIAVAHTPTASIGGQISCNDEPLVSEGPRWARKGLLSSGEQT